MTRSLLNYSKLTKPSVQHRGRSRRCAKNGTAGRGVPQNNGETKNNKKTNQPETSLFERQKKARQQGTLSLPKNAHSLRENWEVADAGEKGTPAVGSVSAHCVLLRV